MHESLPQAGLWHRFDKERFLRRLIFERDINEKNRQQLKNRFLFSIRLRSMALATMKSRFRQERIFFRIEMLRNSLNNKMATLKAIDPQTVLQRGFAIVYGSDGVFIRSIDDISENQIIITHLSDGKFISEVTNKEINRD